MTGLCSAAFTGLSVAERPACMTRNGNARGGTQRSAGLNEAALERQDRLVGAASSSDARVVALLEDQVAYSRKIHYWVRFMGWALFVSIAFAFLAALGLLA